jgi:hypothetical protein
MKTWSTRVGIPRNSPDYIYRAFLDLINRVRKLEKVPDDVNWGVLVDNVTIPEISCIYVQAFWT